ncbi:ribonuclease III [Ceratobasidium sp. AG-Ba]|nr:ribonuclease III [Ceratobasidium sp. AG-Ba]QRW11006.1 ribonuclease III [Ceratobasidium sp. AG-Ba]
MAFLHAHSPLTPTPPLTQPPSEPSPDTQISRLPPPSSILEQNFAEIASQAMDTRVLGEIVGDAWKLERVMRWVPNRTGEGSSKDAGIYKVRGTTVEAVVGGTFHQFGGVAAHRLFHTRVLPMVAFSLPIEYRNAAVEVGKRLGGLRAPILLNQQSPSARLASATG